MTAKDFFTKEEEKAIGLAIATAESETSGEIRVHIENVCRGEVLDRAVFVFKQLNMHKTEQRNGILIYVAVKSQKFAIIGDAGINKMVPADFWDKIKERMQQLFQKKEFANGLCYGIYKAGEHLKQYFPFQQNDKNELSDEISYGKN
ncbi:MAG: TPM domain-containing protein [Syntrophothermus sp.]